MSAVGWLHAALLQGELSLGCRFRHTQPSSRSLGCHVAPKVQAKRERCVSRHATSSGTTAHLAAAQLQQPVTHSSQQQQQQQHEQQYEEQPLPHGHQLQQQQDWQEQRQFTGSSSSQFGRVGTQQQQRRDTTALDKPAVITAAISAAGSVGELQALLDRHGPNLNHIHISAAFVQLQRLWTSSSSSSDSEATGGSRQHSSSNGASSNSCRAWRRAWAAWTAATAPTYCTAARA